MIRYILPCVRVGPYPPKSNYSRLRINNCLITGNNASASGGGIYCYGSSPLLVNDTIQGNSAAGNGGGIYYDAGCDSLVINCIIAGNSAVKGGAAYCYVSPATFVNDTIASNTGDGAIYCDKSTVTVASTIIAANASGLYCTTAPTLRYNCVYGNVAYNYSGTTDPTGSNGNISVDPRLANLPYGDVHIQPGSPCIDAGDNSRVQPSWLDIDSQPRIQATRVDIGADEADGTTWPSGPKVIVRVSPTGNDAKSGSTWHQAKQTVQAAIDAAAQAGGGEVWVQAGTYLELVTLRNYVHVYGGFGDTETARSQRNWQANVTILDANLRGNAITASGLGCYLTTIDGFTIRNGSGVTFGTSIYGGGIYCTNAGMTIANNTITGNRVPSGCGGGIYGSNAGLIVTNNTLSGNAGGGLFCSASRASITGNTVVDNTGSGIACNSSSTVVISGNTICRNSGAGVGGGLYCYSSVAAVSNNRILSNSATTGGAGIFSRYGTVSITNNSIIGNSTTGTAYGGGGMYYSSGTCTLRGNTITNNSAPKGGAISCASTTVEDNIIAFNSSGVLINGASSIRYNCVYGNVAYNYSGMADPTGTSGNVSADPLLTRAAGPGPDGTWGTIDDDYGDLHLLTGSPCINTGDPAFVPASGETDMDSQPRRIGPRIDIGADEFGLVGDINHDGYVNVGDLQLLVAAWGSQGSPPSANWSPDADCNSDGYINVGDLQVLVANWGRSLN